MARASARFCSRYCSFIIVVLDPTLALLVMTGKTP